MHWWGVFKPGTITDVVEDLLQGQGAHVGLDEQMLYIASVGHLKV